MARLRSWVFLMVLFSFCLVKCSGSDAFSATGCVQEFALREGDLMQAISLCVKAQASETVRRVKKPGTSDPDIQGLIEDIENKVVSAHTSEEALDYVANPINAFNLMRRWQLLNDATMNSASFEACRNWASSMRVALPSQEDIEGTAASILRLQRIYQLATADVRRGYIKGHQAREGLSNNDCFLFGKVAMDRQDYGLAAQWLSIAVKAKDGDFSMLEAIQLLARAHEFIGDMPTAVEVIEDNMEQADVADKLEMTLWQYKRKFQQWLQQSGHVAKNMTTWKRPIDRKKIWKDYAALCRGDIGHNRHISPKHTCRYKSGSLGYVRYKEEILSNDPRIGMFYDVISDADAEQVRQLAMPRLLRSLTGKGTGESTEQRVSKVTWLYDTDSAVVRKLAMRVSDATGLETTIRPKLSSSEPFQVLNYGIGGHYVPHYDFFENPADLEKVTPQLLGTGDRIATFIFYLSSVPLGGSSVFPVAGIRVPVVKNAAGFWYNIKLSGELDRRTLHAGCPVLVGSKWVTNKWIHERGQIFRRPCGLKKNSIPAVNE